MKLAESVGADIPELRLIELNQLKNLPDIQQMARRLLINILLGNSDTHLKNWTLIYHNRILPQLSPLYDVVFTEPYIKEDKLALNMVGTKHWFDISMGHSERWAEKAGLPWVVIKPHLLDVVITARAQWPSLLQQLPMLDEHKEKLSLHWAQLHDDFKIV